MIKLKRSKKNEPTNVNDYIILSTIILMFLGLQVIMFLFLSSIIDKL